MRVRPPPLVSAEALIVTSWPRNQKASPSPFCSAMGSMAASLIWRVPPSRQWWLRDGSRSRTVSETASWATEDPPGCDPGGHIAKASIGVGYIPAHAGPTRTTARIACGRLAGGGPSGARSAFSGYRANTDTRIPSASGAAIGAHFEDNSVTVSGLLGRSRAGGARCRCSGDGACGPRPGSGRRPGALSVNSSNIRPSTRYRSRARRN